MMIDTIHGPRDAATLEQREGVTDTEAERTTWIEYWQGGELVHRSVHVTLKVWPAGLGALVGRMG